MHKNCIFSTTNSVKILGNNCTKTLKIESFRVFFNFRVNLRLFHSEKATISSEKHTGQQIGAMLRIFSILIHEVYRRFNKKLQ